MGHIVLFGIARNPIYCKGDTVIVTRAFQVTHLDTFLILISVHNSAGPVVRSPAFIPVTKITACDDLTAIYIYHILKLIFLFVLPRLM